MQNSYSVSLKDSTPNRIWNYSLAGLHAALAIGVGIWLFVGGKPQPPQFNPSLYNLDLKIQNDTAEPTPKLVWKINTNYIKILIILFFAITAVFHLLYATDFFGTGLYTHMIHRGNNWVRWIEYAITATIMFNIICLISGVRDFNFVLLAFFAYPAIMIQGDTVEKYLADKHISPETRFWWTMLPSLVAWFLLVASFVVVFISFAQSVKTIKNAGYKVPNWLYIVVFPMFAWFLSFGVVQIVQIFNVKKKGSSKYQKYEKTYLILSLFSKAFLGLYVAYGLSQSNNEPEK